MGILSLIPGRDWLYLGLLVVCGIAFWTYTAHERSVGKAEIVAADQKAVAAQTIHDNEVDVRANTLVTKALNDYKATVATPIAPSSIPKLVCRQSRGSSSVPPNGGAPSGSNDSTQVPAESDGPPFNPAPAVVQDGRDADAQIILLQQYITTCQQLGKCAK
jgi:hypothetical protein